MSDKEMSDKILEYVTKREDFFYEDLEKQKIGSLAAIQCDMQAASFQETRYFIENLKEQNQ